MEAPNQSSDDTLIGRRRTLHGLGRVLALLEPGVHVPVDVHHVILVVLCTHSHGWHQQRRKNSRLQISDSDCALLPARLTTT